MSLIGNVIIGHNVLHKTSKGMREMNYQPIPNYMQAAMLD